MLQLCSRFMGRVMGYVSRVRVVQTVASKILNMVSRDQNPSRSC